MIRQAIDNIRFPFFSQKEYSDCGIESLRMVLSYHKLAHDKALVSSKIELDEYGTNFLALQNAAQELGLDSVAARVSLAEMSQLPLPVIIHWNHHHFVVVYSIRDDKVLVADPAAGMNWIPTGDFVNNCFNGDNLQVPKASVLLFEKSESKQRYVKSDYGILKVLNLRRLMTSMAGGTALCYLFMNLAAFLCASVSFDRELFLIAAALIVAVMSFILHRADFRKNSVCDRKSLIANFLDNADNSPSHQYRVKNFIRQYFVSKYLNKYSAAYFNGITVITGIFLFVLSVQPIVAAVFAGLVLLYVFVIMFWMKHLETHETYLTANAEEVHRKLTDYLSVSSEFRKVGKYSSEGISFHANGQESVFSKPKYHGWIISLVLMTGMVAMFLLYHYGYLEVCRMMLCCLAFALLIFTVDFMVSYFRVWQKWKFGLSTSDSQPIRDVKLYATVNPETFRPDISLKDVSYRYPSRNFDGGLHNVTLDVPAGSKIAITGRQGGGKSTLMKLLLNQMQPDSGIVSIGGIRPEDINPHTLGSFIGICSDDSELLPGSIEWNITLESRASDAGRLNRVVDAVMLRKFILNMENGLGTRIEPGKDFISDGMKRKILLARLLYQNKPVILIDLEDQYTDQIENLTLYDSLLQYCRANTVIYTTKSDRAAALADKVLLLENGEQMLFRDANDYLAMKENELL